jgi:hypothetical protein
VLVLKLKAETSGCAYHEVTLDKVELVRKALLCSVVGGSLDLVVVVVETSDVCARELDNLSGRATNTTTNIKDLHVVLEVHDVGEVVLVAGNGLFERLAVGETAEVERLAPAVLVKVGGQVVVVTGQGSVFSSSGLFRGSVRGQLEESSDVENAPL